MTRAKKNIDRSKTLLISASVIIFYFLWPQLINVIKELFNHSFDSILEFVSNLILIVGLIYIYRNDLKNYLKDFKKNAKRNILMILIFSILIIVLVPIINLLINSIFKIDGGTSNDNSLLESFKNNPFRIGLMTIIYYPIVEEIVFEKTLKDVISNKWLFMVLSSLFFWYYNIAYSANFTLVAIAGSFSYFAVGLVKAYTFSKTDNLFVPIFIKAIYNALVTFVAVGALIF